MAANHDAKPDLEGPLAGRLAEAIEKRWNELAAQPYASAHRAVMDLTRDGEGILEEAGFEAVPPFPGMLKLGYNRGSADQGLRRYRCTALTRWEGTKAFALELVVDLADEANGHETLLDQMMTRCPRLLVDAADP